MFWFVPRFSPKILDISKIFFFNEMKIKLKLTLYFDFCFVSKLIWSRNSYWNTTSTQTFHKITYNTIIVALRAIKFLDLSISISWRFSPWTFSIKRKFLSKNFITLRNYWNIILLTRLEIINMHVHYP